MRVRTEMKTITNKDLNFLLKLLPIKSHDNSPYATYSIAIKGRDEDYGDLLLENAYGKEWIGQTCLGCEKSIEKYDPTICRIIGKFWHVKCFPQKFKIIAVRNCQSREQVKPYINYDVEPSK